MLQVKSKYFLEMGVNQFNKYHKKKLSRDNNLTTAIGYVVEQSLELILKQFSLDLTGEFPQKHKLEFITSEILVAISKQSPYSMIKTLELKEAIALVEENVRLYNNLAYGAKYIPDLTLSVAQLSELIDITEKLQVIYSKE